MGVLSGDLRDLGYSRTERESPFDDDGTLWTKGYELVCDETGIVIRTDGDDRPFRHKRNGDEPTYRYRNSDKVKLAGGHSSNYEWGSDDDDRFVYDL